MQAEVKLFNDPLAQWQGLDHCSSRKVTTQPTYVGPQLLNDVRSQDNQAELRCREC